MTDTQTHGLQGSIKGHLTGDLRQKPLVNDTPTEQANLQRCKVSTEHSINSAAHTRAILDTDFFEDDENGSLKDSEEYKTSASCVSQQTKEYIQTPCGGPVARRPIKCNINNLFHISQEALRWIQIMVGGIFSISLEIYEIIHQHCKIYCCNIHKMQMNDSFLLIERNIRTWTVSRAYAVRYTPSQTKRGT
jgi:hypothetical protein